MYYFSGCKAQYTFSKHDFDALKLEVKHCIEQIQQLRGEVNELKSEVEATCKEIDSVCHTMRRITELLSSTQI